MPLSLPRLRQRPAPSAAGDPSAADGAATAGGGPTSLYEPVPSSMPQKLLATGLVLAGLYYGRELLVPLALAMLLGFVLNPLVARLRRLGLSRPVAASLVLVVSLGALAGLGVFMGLQVRELARQLPTYQSNINHKFDNLRERLRTPGMFDGATKVLDTVEKEIQTTQKELQAKDKDEAARRAAAREVPKVQVVPPPTSTLQQLSDWGERFGTPALIAGTVLIYLVLVLLDPGDLRDRLVRLLGGSLHRTTDALSEAGERVSRYLLMQVAVNASYAVPLAAGLWLIGVPGAILWGMLSGVLRFVPYVGPMIGAVFPLLLAFAVDPGWSMVLWTLGLIVVIELISNNIVEPWLYGSSTGLSAMSLIVAATFWTALWGPIGLMLSTPLTVCLMVIGRHVPGLQFLDVLLGSQPALDAPTRVYQRLLAGDSSSAIEVSAELSAEMTPRQYYEQVGIPVLRLATADHASVASAEHRHRVVTGMGELIEEMRRLHSVERHGSRLDCLCIGGRWAVDTLGAQMAAHALALDGLATDVVPASNITADFIARIDPRGAKAIVLSYFSPTPQQQARYFCRRLKRRWPDAKIVLALWNVEHGEVKPEEVREWGAEGIVAGIDELVAQLALLLGGGSQAAFQTAAVPEHDVERVRALRASGALDASVRGAFDSAAKRAADIFDVPTALVSLIDDEMQLIRGDARGGASADGEPHELDMPRAMSMCGHVVADGQTMVVPDVTRDPRFVGNERLKRAGVRFYAGAPLCDAEGHVYGTLCLIDTQPRTLSDRDSKLLESLAAEVMGVIRERAAAAPPTSAPVAPDEPPPRSGALPAAA